MQITMDEDIEFIDQSRSMTDIIYRHIAFVKVFGVFFLTFTVFIVPIVLVVTTSCAITDHHKDQSWPNATGNDDIANEWNQNETACVYVKQFHLGESVHATVCNLQGEIAIDFRRFINGSSTILGITLYIDQWRKLRQIAPLIDQAVHEARTYWKTVRKYHQN